MTASGRSGANGRKLALVTGCTGVAGRAIVAELARQGWAVIGVARRPPATTSAPGVRYLTADLGDAAALERALAPFRVTHLFHAAQARGRGAPLHLPLDARALRILQRLGRPTLPLTLRLPAARRAVHRWVAKESGAADPDGSNRRMFRNLLEVLGRPPHDLRHVAVVTGGKHYGMHLGPDLFPAYASPFVEDESPRSPAPNWYFEIEDELRGSPARWTWTVVRPSFLVGPAIGAPYNLGGTLAAYATLCRAIGARMPFWGDGASARARWDVTSTVQLARMMVWSATTPAAWGEAFNCTGGDPFRWRDLWPEVAEWFGLEAAWPRWGISVSRFFARHEATWRALANEAGLRSTRLGDLASGTFADQAMTMDWDAVFSTGKARAAGFDSFIPARTAFRDLFAAMRAERLLP